MTIYERKGYEFKDLPEFLQNSFIALEAIKNTSQKLSQQTRSYFDRLNFYDTSYFYVVNEFKNWDLQNSTKLKNTAKTQTYNKLVNFEVKHLKNSI